MCAVHKGKLVAPGAYLISVVCNPSPEKETALLKLVFRNLLLLKFNR